ncbi:TPA: hypothetical protein ACGVAX_004844 [Vibrio vulnificus]|uniref:hypothetical protein n=1 Tax=Vibrio vulnificus TaxID=672 RepID=UPI001CD0224E|nr:hypothetical protein [Vibrio vulnificus]
MPLFASPSALCCCYLSGLAFVTVFGVIWFDEVPDSYTVLSILLIIVPMMPSAGSIGLRAKDAQWWVRVKHRFVRSELEGRL